MKSSARARRAGVTRETGLPCLPCGKRRTRSLALTSFLATHPFAVRPRRFHATRQSRRLPLYDLGGFCLHGLPVCCNWRQSWGSTRFSEAPHGLPHEGATPPRIALLPFEAFLPDDSCEHTARGRNPVHRHRRLRAVAALVRRCRRARGCARSPGGSRTARSFPRSTRSPALDRPQAGNRSFLPPPPPRLPDTTSARLDGSSPCGDPPFSGWSVSALSP